MCDVLSWVAKLCDILSRVAKLCVMFWPGWQTVYDVLSKRQSCMWCFVQNGKAVCDILSCLTKLFVMFWPSDKALSWSQSCM